MLSKNYLARTGNVLQYFFILILSIYVFFNWPGFVNNTKFIFT